LSVLGQYFPQPNVGDALTVLVRPLKNHISEEDPTIASRETYRSTKFPWWKRLNTYGLRFIDDAKRLGYAPRG